MPKYDQVFDAAGLMESEGLSFERVIRPGVALVIDRDGTKQELDLQGMLDSEGVKNARIDYNSASTALQESPVDLVDRFKMSFGNTKGNAAYLKNKFDDVKVGETGELTVNDGGVWKQIDPSGFGDKDGWQLSEMLGDLADLGGTSVDVVGNIGGSVLGTMVAPGVGTVVGGALGSGAATLANASMGRILGTYDATPEELIKDVGLSMALGALGEGIALGAKHTVMPAIKSFIEKSGFLPGASKKVMSEFLGATTQVESHIWDDAFTHPAEYKAAISGIEARAASPEGLLSNVLGEGAPSSVVPGSDVARDIAARQSMFPQIKALVEGAQKKLSAQWRGRTAEVIANTADDAIIDSTKVISEHSQSLMMSLKSAGVLDDAAFSKGKFLMKSDQELAPLFRTGLEDAGSVKSAVEAYMNSMKAILSEEAPTTGKPAMQRLMSVIKSSDDAYYNIAADNPFVQKLFNGSTAELRSSLSNAAPQKLLDGSTGPGALNRINQWYGALKPSVSKAEAAMAKGTQGIDNMINLYDKSAARSSVGAETFEALASLMPSKAAGQAALNSLRIQNGARKIMSTAPRGIGGGGVVRTAVSAIGGSPKNAYSVAKPILTPMQMAGKAINALDPVAKSSMLNDPEKLGAILNMALQGMKPQQ